MVPRQALLLVHAPVDGDGGEVLLDEELREGHAPLHALDEDDHLWTDGRLDGHYLTFLILRMVEIR